VLVAIVGLKVWRACIGAPDVILLVGDGHRGLDAQSTKRLIGEMERKCIVIRLVFVYMMLNAHADTRIFFVRLVLSTGNVCVELGCIFVRFRDVLR